MPSKAFAKINLTLEVFPRREDGYHGLRSVVVPVSLADTLEFRLRDDGVFTSDTGYENDLILKVARAIAPAGKGVSVHVEKHIPSGGGLGGGSADAAATLLTLNDEWHLGYNVQELAEIGARFGSDIPALVTAVANKCPVLMEGRGEIVTPLTFDEISRYCGGRRDLVLVNPGVDCSTPTIYRAFDEFNFDVSSMPLNYLEPVATSLYPRISTAIAALRRAGATDVRMTGSGSTVFGFTSNAETALAIAGVMRQEFPLAIPATLDVI